MMLASKGRAFGHQLVIELKGESELQAEALAFDAGKLLANSDLASESIGICPE
jgi:hypothetical protein